MKETTSIKELNEIINTKTVDVLNAYKGDAVIPVIETLRSLDYDSYILPMVKDQDWKERIQFLKYGWSLVFRIFYSKLGHNAVIPRYASDKELKEWIDGTIHFSGRIELSKQLLNVVKAKLFTLSKSNDKEFIFKYNPNINDIEYYDRNSIKYYIEMISSTLKEKKEKVLARLPEMRNKLQAIVSTYESEFIQYRVTDEIDEYYDSLAYLYMMESQVIDDFAEDDLFGGFIYGEYLTVMQQVIKTGLLHRDCCIALSGKENHIIDPRNIMSYMFSKKEKILSLSNYLDWPYEKAKKISESFLMDFENYESILSYPGSPCTPYIELNKDIWLMSTNGSLQMPVYILNRSLKRRFPHDYFQAVNNREEKFRNQLYDLFPSERIQKIRGNILLKKGKNVITDIDSVLYDKNTGDLVLIQLKWQDPFYSNLRERYSRISNLLPKSIEWINKLSKYISESTESSVLKKLKLEGEKVNDVYYWIIARHHMNFSGETYDNRAVWVSWFEMIQALSSIEIQNNERPLDKTTKKLILMKHLQKEEDNGEEYSFQMGKFKFHVKK